MYGRARRAFAPMSLHVAKSPFQFSILALPKNGTARIGFIARGTKRQNDLAHGCLGVCVVEVRLRTKLAAGRLCQMSVSRRIEWWPLGGRVGQLTVRRPACAARTARSTERAGQGPLHSATGTQCRRCRRLRRRRSPAPAPAPSLPDARGAAQPLDLPCPPAPTVACHRHRNLHRRRRFRHCCWRQRRRQQRRAVAARLFGRHVSAVRAFVPASPRSRRVLRR